MVALSFVGPRGFQPLINLVTNTGAPPMLRNFAAQMLAEVNLGTNAAWVVPGLLQCLEDPTVTSQVAVTLGELKAEPNLVVPTLIGYLESTNLVKRSAAATALGDYGPTAVEAVPLLLRASTSEYSLLRRTATNALLKIAPEELEKRPH
jgi:HEAT repeat protein